MPPEVELGPGGRYEEADYSPTLKTRPTEKLPGNEQPGAGGRDQAEASAAGEINLRGKGPTCNTFKVSSHSKSPGLSKCMSYLDRREGSHAGRHRRSR